MIARHPERAAQLRKKLNDWSQQLLDPGLDQALSAAGNKYFDHYLDGKIAERPKTVPAARPGEAAKPPGRSPETLFKARDTNKDGFVTLKEYIGNPKNRNVPALTKQFNKRDANKDGRLTLKEMKGTK